jgi:protein pelota
VNLVGSATTLTKSKIEASLPRKKGAAAAFYDKSRSAFFSKVCFLALGSGPGPPP